MAGGSAGVNRAISILRTHIEGTMRLLGVTTLDELQPKHVTQLIRLARGALPRDPGNRSDWSIPSRLARTSVSARSSLPPIHTRAEENGALN